MRRVVVMRGVVVMGGVVVVVVVQVADGGVMGGLVGGSGDEVVVVVGKEGATAESGGGGGLDAQDHLLQPDAHTPSMCERVPGVCWGSCTILRGSRDQRAAPPSPPLGQMSAQLLQRGDGCSYKCGTLSGGGGVSFLDALRPILCSLLERLLHLGQPRGRPLERCLALLHSISEKVVLVDQCGHKLVRAGIVRARRRILLMTVHCIRRTRHRGRWL